MSMRDEKGRFVKGNPCWNKGKKRPEMSGENHPMYGKHISDETRRKLSESMKGREGYWAGKKLNPEHVKKLSESHKGKTTWMKGKKHKPESIQKMKKTWFPKGNTPYNKGIPCSEKTKNKISKSNKGHIPWNKDGGNYSLESLQQMSLSQKKRFENETPWNKGRKMPEISGEKHHLFGKNRTPETIEKIRIARQKQKFPLIDSKPEKIIQIALSLEGTQYQKHKNFKMKSGSYRAVDIFIEPNICIEIDGCYWHSCKQCGYDYPPRIEKDKLINKSLKSQGYKVIRIWEHEIKESVDMCIEKIKNI